jgi:mono/diheme cytochrome c family protein
MVLRLFAVYLISLALTSCGGESSVSESGAVNPEMIDGKKLFNIHCAACHKYNGTGGISGAKDLTSSSLSDEEMKKIISNGAGDMMPFKDVISSEEIDAVIAHIHTLNP